ncbi:unnamed protein product [Prorocentrum cordatum]|uniref:FHA domain-containing protein n=1 Tax=Prorocentrum cordatum TaxID=2364126 RepID=A0ABN9VRQ2_9DINO|nr:unnamed protein product [Polarella glacialis]
MPRPWHPQSMPVPAREPPSGAAAAPPPRVEPARAAPEGVVTINLSFLPPPFALRCTFSRALAASDLERIPVEERTLEASCQEARLLVGRAAQPAALWERLLPEETLRRAVSPEHFEIAVDEEAELVLRNLSSTGTLVNGKTITDSVRVQHADVITVRASARDDVAVLVFRLSVAGEQEDEDSVFSDCPSCSSFAEAGRPRLATESTIIDSGYIAATPLLGLLQRESTAHQREWMCLQREGTLLREWTSGSRAMGDDCIRQAAVRDAAVRPPPVAAVRWPIMPPVREEQGAIEI